MKFSCTDISLSVFKYEDNETNTSYILHAIVKDGVFYYSFPDIAQILKFSNTKTLLDSVLMEDEYIELDPIYSFPTSYESTYLITEDGLYNLLYVTRSPHTIPFKQFLKAYLIPYTREYYAEYKSKHSNSQ